MIAQPQQQQRQTPRTQLPTPIIFQATQTNNKIYLRAKLSDNLLKYFKSEHVLPYLTQSQNSIGKYKQLKFATSLKQKSIMVEIEKYYYFQILNTKKYQVLLMIRNYQNVTQDFVVLAVQMLTSRLKLQCRMMTYDVLSLTFIKDFSIINQNNQPQVKRLFLKISPFIFRKNFYIKSKQCQQFFAGIIKTYTPQNLPRIDQVKIADLPTNQQFFKSPRFPIIDDMYSNQSFIKRFSSRFYTFYQAYNLLQGGPLQNKYINQFYQKCVNKSIISTMRLKKMSFHVKIPSIIDKQKAGKASLIFHCLNTEQQRQRQKQKQKPKQIIIPIPKPITFSIQISADPQLNQKNGINSNFNTETFIKNFQASINNSYDQKYIKILTNQNNAKGYNFVNQVGFARIFNQFYFYLQRYMFKILKSNKQITTQNTNSFKDPFLYFRLPVTQEYIGKKYAYRYSIQIKSYYTNVLSSIIQQQKNNKYPYENIIHNATMHRRKVAKDIGSNPSYQNLQFLYNQDQIRGMCVYINQVFKKWSLIDCYNDINNFVANYLNIIVDKNKQKQKNQYKSTYHWKFVIDQLSGLVQSLTRSFNNSETTIIIYFLRTYEDFPKQQQITKQQISQNQQAMLLTFKIMKLTIAGWVQIIPSCQFFFQMYRDATYFYSQSQNQSQGQGQGGNVNKQQILINKSKQHIQKKFRSYLDKNLKYKCDLPPLYYSKENKDNKDL